MEYINNNNKKIISFYMISFEFSNMADALRFSVMLINFS